MQLLVDPIQRYWKMRAHTATHLLHSELTKIFPSTKQAWSLVDSDYLRFDFYADRLLSDDEVKSIEKNINLIISNAFTVSIEELEKKEAENLWAKMFFEDKYGDIVRVVSIADSNSVEFCGGTHVTNTKDIGIFKIIWQQAVASGVKRITALVWPKVNEFISEQTNLLQDISSKLDCSISQIAERLDKMIDNYQLASNTLQSINANLLWSLSFEDKEYYKICNLSRSILGHISLKDLVAYLKGSKLIGTYLFTDNSSWFLIWSTDDKAKKLMGELWRKGGGNESLCQGKVN